jgi:peptide chain release factor 3
MAIEKERGISISSTAMSFPYRGIMMNLLDTPGHADFSEDTYRTLSAADNALMLVDAGKGLEPQTRKLFEVCRLNGLPVFTFINKMDRPSLAPLELLDQIEKEFSLATYPVNWPIGAGDRFRGVYHRPTKQLSLFTKVASGSREAKVVVMSADDPAVKGMMDADLYEQVRARLELLLRGVCCRVASVCVCAVVPCAEAALAHAQMLEDIELLEELGGEFDLEARAAHMLRANERAVPVAPCKLALMHVHSCSLPPIRAATRRRCGRGS